MRLVLVGGGHAHLRVLEELSEEGWPGAEVTLISLHRHHHYSGMVPGLLEGRYEEPQLRFDLAALARSAGVRFVEGRVCRIGVNGDRSGGVVELEDGAIPFDRASLDVGSVPVGRSLPGVAEHAFSVRPMSRVVELVAALDRQVFATAEGGEVRVVVAGAGAAGVEVALTIEARIARGGRQAEVVLVDAGPRILPGFAPKVRGRAEELLAGRGIRVRTEVRVDAVESDGVRLAAGDRSPTEVESAVEERLPADLTVWMTGAAPPPLLAESDLPLSPDGFFLVDSRLRAVDGAPVWGAGDCIAFRSHPDMPRAGVYAVRQGPVLARNLGQAMGATAGGGAGEYDPQESFLALLNTGDDRALLRWWKVVAHARWCLWLKDRIDRRFMARYQELANANRG